MSDPLRCEPADQSRDGWHWLERNGRPVIGHWHADKSLWWDLSGGSPLWVKERGYRYLQPVPTPAEIAALVDQASDALGELYLLGREHAGLVAALAAFPAKETT